MDKTALKQDARAYMDSRRAAMIDQLCELCACDTTNPPGNEELAAVPVRRFLEQQGIRWTEHSAEAGRPNLQAEIGSGNSPRLYVACHLDVVPAGPGWISDPFKPRREGSRIVARGATDNKAAFPGMLDTAAFLKRHEAAMKGTLIIGAVSDEERGSNKGLKWLVAEKLIRADYGLIPDNSGELAEIAVGEKGLLEIEVRTTGKAAHASRPDYGVNAIAAMNVFLDELRDYKLPGKPHPLFTMPTLNVGMIQGGHASNIVPDHCELRLNIRYLPGTTAAQILEELRSLAQAVPGAVPGSTIELEITEDQPAWVLEDEPARSDTRSAGGAKLPPANLLAAIKTNTREVTGKEPKSTGLAGTTVAKLLYFGGIPSVNFGPGHHSTPHIANEWVEQDQVVDFGKILAGVCVDLLF